MKLPPARFRLHTSERIPPPHLQKLIWVGCRFTAEYNKHISLIAENDVHNQLLLADNFFPWEVKSECKTKEN